MYGSQSFRDKVGRQESNSSDYRLRHLRIKIQKLLWFLSGIGLGVAIFLKSVFLTYWL